MQGRDLGQKGNATDPLRQRRLITPAFSRRQDSPIADLIGKCLMEVSALSEPLTTDSKYPPTPLLIKTKQQMKQSPSRNQEI